MDFQNFLQSLISWFFSSGIKIILIIIGGWLTVRIGRKFIDRAVRKAVRHEDREAELKRENTLIRIFSGGLTIMVWLVVFMMILDVAGLSIGPVLAGAGILGVALGFGAQYMIRDFLAGLFVVLENQYRVGDVACFDGTCGLVEDITLRKTVLRDLDGVVHHVPNGEIRKASNLSKGFARVNLNVGVAYGANLEKVIEVINRVGRELAEDPQWKPYIKKTPQFLRVDDFADSAVIVKILGETKPLKQWDVTGELRKRLKTAFDQEGIEIPFPQMSVWPRGSWEKKSS
jgi:small conductance mechanosensitive channel